MLKTMLKARKNCVFVGAGSAQDVALLVVVSGWIRM